MPKTACPYCGQRSNDGHLCTHCTDSTRRNLTRIIDLWPALEEAITRRDNIGGGNGEIHAQTIHAPLPYNEQASRAAEKVRRILLRWAHICVQDHNADIPANTVPALCRTISNNRRNLRRHWDAGGWAWDIAMCVRWISVNIDLSDRRAIAGPCPETTTDGEPCPGVIMAVYPADDRTSPHLDCTRPRNLPDAAVCGQSWPAKDFRRMGARIAARQAQIDNQIARATKAPMPAIAEMSAKLRTPPDAQTPQPGHQPRQDQPGQPLPPK